MEKEVYYTAEIWKKVLIVRMKKEKKQFDKVEKSSLRFETYIYNLRTYWFAKEDYWKDTMSRYDSRTTTFSPEGRLHQVEYAMKAIDQAGVCVGILTKEGIVFGAEKKAVSKLLAPPKGSEKMYKIDNHIAVAVAGLASDANILIQHARVRAQQHKYSYQEPVPVETLVLSLADIAHTYTMYGGQRPFGVSFLIGGWDKTFNFQLYHADPSGNYIGWNAIAIGSNNQMARDMLKKEYKEDIGLQDALKLAAKVLAKAMDTQHLTDDKMEFSVLRRLENETMHQCLTRQEAQMLLKGVEDEQANTADE